MVARHRNCTTRINPESDGCDMRGSGIRADRRGREIGAGWSEDVVE